MKGSLKKAISLLLVANTFWWLYPLHAEEKLPGEKSSGVVWTLAALPINGPALMYAEHPVQGTVLTIVEIVGLLGIIPGMLRSCGSAEDPAECRMWQKLFIGGGSVLWFPSWLYSLVRAPLYVEEHNRKIREKQAFVSPWVNLKGDSENTKSFGLSFRF